MQPDAAPPAEQEEVPWAEAGGLSPFAAFVQGLADLDLESAAPADGLLVEEVRLELPVELRVEVEEDGQVRVSGAPPTQHVETTVMPVFHRLSLRVTRSDGE